MTTATISDIAWKGYRLCGQRDGMATPPERRREAMSQPEISGGSEARCREETDIKATKAASA